MRKHAVPRKKLPDLHCGRAKAFHCKPSYSKLSTITDTEHSSSDYRIIGDEETLLRDQVSVQIHISRMGETYQIGIVQHRGDTDEASTTTGYDGDVLP